MTLFAMPCSRYHIGTDSIRHGWWKFMVRFKKESHRLTISWGWAL